ncbi:hypothetical protein ScPMuIL_017730 [Solemya velum]
MDVIQSDVGPDLAAEDTENVVQECPVAMKHMKQNGFGANHLTSHDKQNGYIVRTIPEDWGWNWDDTIPIPRLSFSLSALIVAIISVICFINCYDGDFVFDDSEAVVGNQDILPTSPLLDLFSHDFWGNKLDSKTSHKSYRPLTVLTFRWNYLLSGELHPHGFHIANIILHGVVSVLMLCVFSLMFGGLTQDKETQAVLFQAPRASLLCTLLFAVHPVHTESVAGIVGRADLLCAVFFLLSFILYVKSCAAELVSVEGKNVLYRPLHFSVPCMTASMMLCGLSILCKEQGITILGLCSAYDIVGICRINISQFFSARDSKCSQNRLSGQWFKSLVHRQIFILFAGILFLVIRWRIMGSTPPTFQVFDNPHSFVNGTLMRTLNYNYLYAINGWLLINPWWLCFDWSMGCIPTITSLTDPRIIAGVVLWIVLASLISHCFSGEFTKDQRILLLGLAFLIVPFLPACNLFFRVGFVIAERVLYLSSAGFCMIVLVGVRQLSKHSQLSRVVKYGVPFLLFIYTVRSIQRSSQWRDEMSLFTSGAKVCPDNAKVHYNIGKLYSDNGHQDSAIQEYRLAIQLNPEYDQAMNNLGNILKELQQLDEAESLLERAVEIRPEFAAAWMNLGIVQTALNKNDAAEKSYFTAIRHRRKYPDCYFNLGNLYLGMKKHSLALEAWQNATNLKPTHSNAWNNMVILLDTLEMLKEAESVGKTALRILPEDSQIIFSMANLMGKQERYKDSEQYFLRALEIEPNNAKILANLGVLYHRWAKYEAAEKAYRQALTLEPNNASTKENLKMLQSLRARK